MNTNDTEGSGIPSLVLTENIRQLLIAFAVAILCAAVTDRLQNPTFFHFFLDTIFA